MLQCNAALGSNSVMEEIIAGFPTMLQTSSAAAIWLFKLDSLIAPYLERVHLEKDKECTRFKGMPVFLIHLYVLVVSSCIPLDLPSVYD